MLNVSINVFAVDVPCKLNLHNYDDESSISPAQTAGSNHFTVGYKLISEGEIVLMINWKHRP